MRKCIVLLMSVIMLFSLSLTAFAVDDVLLVQVHEADDATELSKVLGTNFSSNGSPTQQYFRCTDGYVYLSGAFDLISVKEQISTIEDFLLVLNRANVQTSTKQAIYTCLYNNIDSTVAVTIPELIEMTSADMLAAQAWYKPFEGTVGLILGILCIVIMTVTVATTVCDLMYLGIPAFHNAITRDDGEGVKLPVVSRDSIAVYKEYATSNITQNIYLVYFKRRVITIIILAVCVLYLASGQIAGIIGFFLEAAQNIVGND